MADYKIYNPDCDAAKHGEIGPTVHINQLDQKTQAWIEQVVRMELLRNPLNEPKNSGWSTYAIFEDDVRRAMNNRICDIEKIVPTTRILDEWALNNSFDPAKVETTEAGWLAFDNAGRQMAFVVSLMEDELSPNGESWNVNSFAWTPSGETDGADMWVNEHEGAFYGYQNADELEGELVLPDAPDGVEWNLIRADVPLLEDELNIWSEVDKTPRKATPQEISKLVRDRSGEAAAEPYIEENTRLSQEVDALNSELEELRVAIAEYRASENRSENLLIERDKQIESLKERLSAYEDVSDTKLSALVEKPELVSRLSIADFDHRSSFEHGTGNLVGESYDYSDERLDVHIEDSPNGWTWDLEVNGTKQLGIANSPVEAISKAKTAYGQLVAPPSQFDAQPVRNDAQLFPHPGQLEVSVEQHGSENLTVYSYGWDDENAPLQVQFAHSSVTDDYSWQASLYDGDNAVTAFKAGVNATFEDAYVAASAELAAVNPNAVKVQNPLFPGVASRATSIAVVRNQGELKAPEPAQTQTLQAAQEAPTQDPSRLMNYSR